MSTSKAILSFWWWCCNVPVVESDHSVRSLSEIERKSLIAARLFSNKYLIDNIYLVKLKLHKNISRYLEDYYQPPESFDDSYLE